MIIEKVYKCRFIPCTTTVGAEMDTLILELAEEIKKGFTTYNITYEPNWSYQTISKSTEPNVMISLRNKES